jgi:hypothetical protein
MFNRERSIWRTPETYIAALIFLALIALGFWWGGGFKFYFVAKPVISG